MNHSHLPVSWGDRGVKMPPLSLRTVFIPAFISPAVVDGGQSALNAYVWQMGVSYKSELCRANRSPGLRYIWSGGLAGGRTSRCWYLHRNQYLHVTLTSQGFPRAEYRYKLIHLPGKRIIRAGLPISNREKDATTYSKNAKIQIAFSLTAFSSPLG